MTISSSGVPPRLKSTPERLAPARRPPAPRWTSLAASSSRWARVIPTSRSRPSGSSTATRPPTQSGCVVLGDLVRLGEVRIEVVLPVELAGRRHGQPSARPARIASSDRLAVDHRQHARVGQADRAGVRVRRVAEAQLAQPQNIFVRGRELDVDLQPDDRLPGPRSQSPPAVRAVEADARASSACATRRSAVLAEGRPGELEPDGQPVGEPAGDRQRGQPGEAGRGSCRRPTRYIASGSSTRSPSGRPASARSARPARPRARRRRSKSRRISVRTFCARR